MPIPETARAFWAAQQAKKDGQEPPATAEIPAVEEPKAPEPVKP